MTITTWPIDATPAVPGRQLREAHSVYMAGASATDPFGVRSGVRPGTSPTTVTATSTTWTVGAHAGVVDLQPAVEASGYEYAVNATGGLPSGAVTAADLTRPRVDIVWVRNDDPSEGDASPNPTVVFGYTAGVPLAIPVAPATPARCMVLATIQVPMSGGGSPTVIWRATYATAAVLIPLVYTDAGLATSGTVNVFTTATRTITDPFGPGVPFRCETTYYLGYVSAAAGITARAYLNVNGSGSVWAIISATSSAAPRQITDMPAGGSVFFQGVLTNLSGTMATVLDAGAHFMTTKVSPL